MRSLVRPRCRFLYAVLLVLLVLCSTLAQDEADARMASAQEAAKAAAARMEAAAEAAVDAASETVNAAAEATEEAIDEVVKKVSDIASPAEPEPASIGDKIQASAAKTRDLVRDTAKDTAKSTSSALKSFVSSIHRKTDALIKRVKNLDQQQVKKITAAAVGVWGVAVGVGYLATKND